MNINNEVKMIVMANGRKNPRCSQANIKLGCYWRKGTGSERNRVENEETIKEFEIKDENFIFMMLKIQIYVTNRQKLSVKITY